MNQFLRILKFIGLFCLGIVLLSFLFRIGIILIAFIAGGALTYHFMKRRPINRYRY